MVSKIFFRVFVIWTLLRDTSLDSLGETQFALATRRWKMVECLWIVSIQFPKCCHRSRLLYWSVLINVRAILFCRGCQANARLIHLSSSNKTKLFPNFQYSAKYVRDIDLNPLHMFFASFRSFFPPWSAFTQKSWITQCMLKCRRIWCMFFMRGLPTSILADTSLGTWNSVAVWNYIIARQSLGQNSTNIGPYLQTNTWVWNCAWNSSMLLSRQPCFSVCTRWHWRKCNWKASTYYSARCCDQLLVGCEWMARIGLRRCDEWITDSVWLWNSSLFHHGRNNLPNANFN